MKRTLLFHPEPGDGGDNAPAPASPAGAPPPAAAAVGESDVQPQDAGELVELRRKLQESENRAKKAETDAAYLQDENRRLKTPPPAPAPAPAKAKSDPWTVYEACNEAEGAD